MKIWHIRVTNDGQTFQEDLAASEKEARARVVELAGDKANGYARRVDVNTDKDGVIALFRRVDFVKNTEAAFDITNGRWKERVGPLPT